MTMARGVLDVRWYDWSTFNPSPFGAKDCVPLSPCHGRPAGSGFRRDHLPAGELRSLRDAQQLDKAFGASWLVTAFAAAVALGRFNLRLQL